LSDALPIGRGAAGTVCSPAGSEGVSACLPCLRRAWLLGALNGRLEYRGRDHARLIAMLELSDEELIHALGAEERERLLARYTEPEDLRMPLAEGVQRICRHDPATRARWRAGAARRGCCT
jgi:hypothetical protein